VNHHIVIGLAYGAPSSNKREINTWPYYPVSLLCQLRNSIAPFNLFLLQRQRKEIQKEVSRIVPNRNRNLRKSATSHSNK
jgi:hypothetical protein